MRFGIFLYEGAEPIDLATFGVLSVARRLRPEIGICTITPDGGITTLASGLRIVADHDIGTAPRLDVLVVTGGPAWVAQSRSVATLDFIRRHAASALIVSVCTGGMILAASGTLDGRAATTKSRVMPPEVSPLHRMHNDHPQIDAREASLVDTGGIITGGGVTLCIDTMLHVLERHFGAAPARETARSIEYHRAWAANLADLPPLVVRHPLEQ